MNDEHKTIISVDTSSEDELRSSLIAAFNTVEPSDEAQKRMLKTVLATRIAKRKRSPQKIMLPIAASLILLLGIGAFVLFNLAETPFESGSKEALTEASMSEESAAKSFSENAADTGSGDITSAEECAEVLSVEELDAPATEQDTSEEAAPAHETAYEYPLVESESLGQLSVISDIGLITVVPDDAYIGEKLEDVYATNSENTDSITCTIYRYREQGEIPSYAIQYEDHGTFYLATAHTS